MKKFLLVLSSFVLLWCHSSSQTSVFWTEDFEAISCPTLCSANGYTSGNGTWTTDDMGLPNDVEANEWYISCAENGCAIGECGAGCGLCGSGTDHTAHIANVPTARYGSLCAAGDCGAAYDATVPSNWRFSSPIIDATGRTGITLEFDYIARGDMSLDRAVVEYSVNGGGTFNTLMDPLVSDMSSPLCGGLPAQGRWTLFSQILPATCDNQPDLVIAFKWANDATCGTCDDPSFAINNVRLYVPVGLPIELSSFFVQKEQNKAQLSWKSSGEQSEESFTVQRSADNQSFETLGVVETSPTPSPSENYEFVDPTPLNGRNYYRLSQKDKNGNTNYSETRQLNFDFGGGFQITSSSYEKANSSISFRYSSTSSLEANVSVINLKGKEVFQEKGLHIQSGKNLIELKNNGISSGMYFLKVEYIENGKNMSHSRKLLIP